MLSARAELVLSMAHFLSSANTKGQSEKDAGCFMVGEKHRDFNIYYRYHSFCPHFNTESISL